MQQVERDMLYNDSLATYAPMWGEVKGNYTQHCASHLYTVLRYSEAFSPVVIYYVYNILEPYIYLFWNVSVKF